MNCAAEVQAALVEQRIKLGHAELLAGLDKDRQGKVLSGVLEHKVPVDVLRKQLGQFAKRLADAIFDTSPCLGCPHNSALQAALFDESIGEGFCQHPTHYEELTMAALEARATPLRERFQVVRFVKAQDGFTPLVVSADGPLGVGGEQYGACKGCASFGCSVSAVPGSLGDVAESLCFDAACHSRKVAARHAAEREAARSTAAALAGTPPSPGRPDPQARPQAAPSAASKYEVPAKLVAFRQEQWRRWSANALMAQPGRNQRVLAALVLAGDASAVKRERYGDVAKKVAGFEAERAGTAPLRKVLEQVHRFEDKALPTLVRAVAAAAAYGVDDAGLEALLNYLEVDEAKCFVLDRSYLDLLTVSELESLAEETGLRKAMAGSAYQKAKAGKRAGFIDALLAVQGFAYAGTVPRAMRYPRRRFKPADGAVPVPSAEGVQAASTAADVVAA